MVYHAYQLTTEDVYHMEVDTDRAALWDRLAENLGTAEQEGGIVSLEMGTVEGVDVKDALNNIRAGVWLTINSCRGAK